MNYQDSLTIFDEFFERVKDSEIRGQRNGPKLFECYQNGFENIARAPCKSVGRRLTAKNATFAFRKAQRFSSDNLWQESNLEKKGFQIA